MRWIKYIGIVATTAGIIFVGAGTQNVAVAAGNPPVNTTPPSIAGIASLGQSLTASAGVWSGDVPISYTYQWQRCGYRQAVLADGPAGYWRLADRTASAVDELGAHDGVYQGGATQGVPTPISSDSGDTAASFDGTSGTVGLGSGIQFDAGDFTVEGWFKTTVGTGYQDIFVQDPGTATVILKVQSGHAHLFVRDATGAYADLDSATAQANGRWHYAVGVRQGSSFSLYLDGTRVATATAALGDVDASTVSSLIGGRPAVDFFSGSLDEVAVYKKALTATQILHHYQNATTAPCSSIAGATAQSYTSGTDDMGSKLQVKVTATNASGSASAFSSATSVVQVAAPTISGSNGLGDTLSATGGAGAIPSTLQWQRCSYQLYPDAVWSDNPAAYWSLDDSGTTVAEEMAGLDGTYTGGTTHGVAGALPTDLSPSTTFDGTSAYASLPAPAFDSGAFTIEGWFETTSTAIQQMWSSGYTGGSQGVELTVYAGDVRFYVGDTATNATVSSAGRSYADGLWHQVVATRSGSTSSLYVDGIEVGQKTFSVGDVDASGVAATIGRGQATHSSHYFSGGLDEMSVYLTALSPSTIDKHFQRGRGTSCTDISGQVGASHVVATADLGSSIRVVETVTGTQRKWSTPAAASAEASGSITYAQAVAAGFPTPSTPADYGLPACSASSNDGFLTAADAAAALAAAPEEPTCAEDPSQATLVIGDPSLTAASPGSAQDPHYRWSGADTTARYQGGQISVETSHPSVTTVPLQHVAGRVLAKKANTGRHTRWIEMGWFANYGTMGNPYSYSYNTSRRYIFPGPPLTAGHYYNFRVRDCGATLGVCADYMKQDGSWKRLDHYPAIRCVSGTGTTACLIEEFLEVYIPSPTAPWPDLNAPLDGDGVNFKNAALRTAPNTWPTWDATRPTRASNDNTTSPYRTCWANLYYDFRVTKATC